MFPAGASQTRLFLTSDTPDTLLLMQELWDKNSRLPGLLNARNPEHMDSRSYLYDPRTRKYYSPSGRQITDKQLRAAVKRMSNEASKRMKKEISQLIAGTIILAVWYSRVRDLMKALYKTIWLLSIGGFLFDDDTQRNLFYLFILSQFDYFDNFVYQVESGEQVLDGFAVTRAGMYGRWGNAEWQDRELDLARADGLNEARRVLGPNENHCHDSNDRPGCLELAEKGWMDIDLMVPIGEATCYSNCLCYIEYR